MKKRLISLLICLAMICTLLPFGVMAADAPSIEVTDEKIFDKITSLDEETLTAIISI